MKQLRALLGTRYSVLVLIAIAVRLILIPNPGFEADISFWKSWGLATVDKGIVEGMKITNNNYPTPFAYTLGAMVWIYKLFANPHNFSEFWSNTNLLFLTISKLVPILADFGIAGIFLYIGKHAKRLGFPVIADSLFMILAIVYLLNPIAIIDGAWWGQVDSLGVFIFLIACLLSLSRRPFWAGAVFTLAMMTKLQNMIYAPVFFLFVWQWSNRFPESKPPDSGNRALMQAAAGTLLGFAGLNSEFLLSRNMDRVFASLTENYDYFPWMSLMAYNLWWIVSGARGLVTSDKLTVLGILNAKTVGLLLFSSFYLFAALRQFFERKKLLQTFLESIILINGAFFLFQTQSHDRYAFPLVVFLLLWAPFWIAIRDKKEVIRQRLKLFSFLFSLFTIFYFYNLHTALAVNYPQNSIPLLATLTQPVFTITTAYILLGLFGVFLVVLIKSSRLSLYSFLCALILFVGFLFYLNKPLWTNQPIRLTRITPYISEQAYGTRQTDRSVQSSFGGPYKWTRLSVQYIFYKHGIGTHANSKQVFDIHRKFQRFTTDVGIDTEAGSKASAIFEIYGDGNLLYSSEKMSRFDLPKHADVNISNVNNLMLITTDAGDGNTDDHTDWLNPILWP